MAHRPAALVAACAGLALAACAEDPACRPPDPDFAAWSGQYAGSGARLGDGGASCAVDVVFATGNAAGGLGGGDPHCDRVFLQVDLVFTGAACQLPITPTRLAWIGEPALTATRWSVPLAEGVLTLDRAGDEIAGDIPGYLQFSAVRTPVP